MYVNTKEWEKLPKQYQEAFVSACAECNIDMMAEYDFKNPPALQKLIQNGVKLHSYSTEIMKAAQTAAFALYEEEASKNTSFKKIYEPWKKFRNDQFLWNKVAEQTLSSFMFSNSVK
jgi:TRAP-type mannitol/chloroaromatic compound transport system substrate-binding protein